MKKQCLILILLSWSTGLSTLFAQSPATVRGASIITGGFSFTSQGGDLYGFNDERLNSLTFTPTYLVFVADRFAVGANWRSHAFGEANSHLLYWVLARGWDIFLTLAPTSFPFLAEDLACGFLATKMI